MLKHLLLALAMMACVSLSAQTASQYPWEFGLRIGTASMAGDLTEPDVVIMSNPGIGVGLHVRRRIGSILALKLQVLYGQIDSKEDNDRGFEFRPERGRARPDVGARTFRRQTLR